MAITNLNKKLYSNTERAGLQRCADGEVDRCSRYIGASYHHYTSLYPYDLFESASIRNETRINHLRAYWAIKICYTQKNKGWQSSQQRVSYVCFSGTLRPYKMPFVWLGRYEDNVLLSVNLKDCALHGLYNTVSPHCGGSFIRPWMWRWKSAIPLQIEQGTKESIRDAAGSSMDV